ncbi:MAG: amidase [Candidatus Dormibacteraeota bacterium]|nr:amidase [Candidatus Dormibacteraeota bacterium]
MPSADVGFATIAAIQSAVASGELRPEEVARVHLERIARLDPALRAYVHVDLGARPGAGPLSGVTLAVKDTQPVAGMPWTYGSRRFADRVAESDALVVARARDAGVAVLGKTNLPELAAAVGTANELFGATRNPWREGVTPGGSSGGSGAAVAAGLCTIAYGDDMGGSIRVPASCCGVLGLRPSAGRVPEEHPDPTNLSVRGPLARSVADLRSAFALMTAEAIPPTGPHRVLRIGLVGSSPLTVAPACAAAVRAAAAALTVAGHSLEPVTWNPLPVAHAYQVVRPCSVADQPGEPDEYGAAVRNLIARGRATTVRDYLAALGSGLEAAAPLRRTLESCDAILSPTLGRPPMAIADVPPFLSEEWLAYTQFVLPVSFSGLPAVSVPAGLAEGLPVGVQLTGRPFGEWALLDLAAELEAAPGFGYLRPPGLD